MSTVRLLGSQVDALDDLNLITAVLRAYGWDTHEHRSRLMDHVTVTATAYTPAYEVTVDYASLTEGRWARQIRVHWLHSDGPSTAYAWPLADPPFDTILNVDDPVTSEAQLAMLCGGIDLRDVA
jgi:hypothetical protein